MLNAQGERGVERPALLADSHCHLLDDRLVSRADEIIAHMGDDNLDFIIEVGTGANTSYEAFLFAQKHNNVFCTVGVHPHLCNEYGDEFERFVTKIVSKEHNHKIVAIGECGLDYYHMTHPKEIQRDVFIKQILLAEKLGLPLVIHTRDAWADTIEILTVNKSHIKHGILFHCFSHGADEIVTALQYFGTGCGGVYFAFGGAVTYTNANPDVTSHGKSTDMSNGAIRACPLDRMLLETDAPYLNPKPAGGKKHPNEPKNVHHVAQYIAELLEIPLETIAEKTLKNTRRFFRI